MRSNKCKIKGFLISQTNRKKVKASRIVIKIAGNKRKINQQLIKAAGRCNFRGANRERVFLIRHFPSTPICELLYDRRAEFIGYHYREVIAVSVASAVNGLILSHHNLEQNGNNIHNR